MGAGYDFWCGFRDEAYGTHFNISRTPGKFIDRTMQLASGDPERANDIGALVADALIISGYTAIAFYASPLYLLFPVATNLVGFGIRRLSNSFLNECLQEAQERQIYD